MINHLVDLYNPSHKIKYHKYAVSLQYTVIVLKFQTLDACQTA